MCLSFSLPLFLFNLICFNQNRSQTLISETLQKSFSHLNQQNPPYGGFPHLINIVVLT